MMQALALNLLRLGCLVAVAVLCFMFMGEAEWQNRMFSPVRGFGINDRDELLYVAESGGDIGPGSNESGVRVFLMPERVAQDIAAGGIQYLNGLPAPRPGSSLGRPWDWRVTPVPDDDADWPRAGGTAPSLADIMERYWHQTDVTPEMRELVDGALASEMSFYALDGGDLFLMIPQQRRVIFAHGG